jgi:protein-ribulosamine 3-kinase
MVRHSILCAIEKEANISVDRVQKVRGGDINQAFQVFSPKGNYFLKVNQKDAYPGMFDREAEGLQTLGSNTELRVPDVICTGETDMEQYLLLEWIDRKSAKADSMRIFGAALATMHKKPGKAFGWERDNYIGSLKQVNTQTDSWQFFYTHYRIHPLVNTLVDLKRFTSEDLHISEKFCNRLNTIFPDEPPALLHGDLWSGNFMFGPDGYAVIFDPAVYCGNREMDIGMTRLFGGFDQSFYEAYNEVYPLESDWERRLPFAQLYPLLVHAVLFGGHYTTQALQIMKST